MATLVYREVGTTSDLSLGMEPGGPVGSGAGKVRKESNRAGSLSLTRFPGGW